jgi:hypothetical protein
MLDYVSACANFRRLIFHAYQAQMYVHYIIRRRTRNEIKIFGHLQDNQLSDKFGVLGIIGSENSRIRVYEKKILNK